MSTTARFAFSICIATASICLVALTASAQSAPGPSPEVSLPNCLWTPASGGAPRPFGLMATSLDECLAHARGQMVTAALDPRVNIAVRKMASSPMMIRFSDATGRPQQCVLTPIRAEYEPVNYADVVRGFVPLGQTRMLIASPEINRRLDANIRVDCPTI